MEVVVTDVARDHIGARGGTVYVRAHPHRCCTGALTVLDATTSAPAERAGFELFESGEVRVMFCRGTTGEPRRLTIDLQGRRRRRPVALWDGCAYKL